MELANLATFVFFGFLVIMVLIAIIYGAAHIRADYSIKVDLHREHLVDRETTRHLAITRLNPDNNGNYPVHYNPETLEYISPTSGNHRQANPIYFQPGAGANRPDKITVMKPQTPNEIRINAYNAQRVLGEVDTDYMERLTPSPEIPEISAPSPERKFEPKQAENPISDGEIREILAAAKLRGEGKTNTLKALGAKPGDNPQWRYLGNVWDEL